ncbi:MAG: hypothetical protein LRY41_03260 [Candidatus Pacebacteria bacterium]|nr:hypothetical protein [Candidatus Paceibacterota bacterium]
MKKRALAAAFGLLHAFSAMAGSAGTQADAFDNKAHEDFQKNFKTEQERVATQKTADKSTVYFSDFSQYEPEIITKTKVDKKIEGFSIDVEQTFKTDKADISPESAQKIYESAQEFLASISAAEAQNILDADWKLFGSSDERPTNAWGERGNEALTEARLNAAFKIFDDARQNFDFAQAGLSADVIEQIKNKKITFEMPEGGVTHVAEFINPATGENFTEAEIASLQKNNPAEFALLLQKARIVEFRLDVTRGVDQQDVPQEDYEVLEPSIETNTSLYERTTNLEMFRILDQYDAFTLGLDNSQSVDYAELIDGLSTYAGERSDVFEKMKHVASFSHNADAGIEIKNLKSFNNFIKKIENKGDNRERIVTSAIQMLDREAPAAEGMKKALIMWSDEMIQDAEYIQALQQKAQEKGIDVIFALSHDKTKEVALVPSGEILKAYEANKSSLVDHNGKPIAGKSFYVGIADFTYGPSVKQGYAHRVILENTPTTPSDGGQTLVRNNQ